ncbi:RBBP9/YdeN family alpha/beta hydrolase [Cellulomonas sp. P22]|uniref:RBBP9/YdeN family alpha/beta hydrolase n=1 Tax=Cellulomonas sp. P22 TaxID=3373189 RepID=UPI0037946BB9
MSLAHPLIPVFVAGIGNSGPAHWQAAWHDEMPHGVWVEHESWDRPVRDAWVRELDETLRAVEGPKVLVAHSLGCTLVTEWAAEHVDDEVVAALLVAVPDVGGSEFPAEARGFEAPRRRRLPFRTIVVTSENDQFGTPEHAAAVAHELGAELVSVGRKGHINEQSGLGGWSEGKAILDGLLDRRLRDRVDPE